MASLISIGVTGLTASQTALTTTGNNITNANTPGYSRQRVNLGTLPEQFTGNGYVGAGVNVNSITRVVEQFAIGQLRTNTSIYNAADTLATQYEYLDSLLADSSTGIAPSLQSYFGALQQASQDPTSVATRQVVLSAAGSLSQRFNTLYDQITSQKLAANEQLNALTAQVSSLAQGISRLNKDIADQIGGGNGAMPNELLDKRDELVRQLSEIVDVRVTETSNQMNIFIGSGQPLVVGNECNTLTTAASPTDPSRQQVMFTSGGVSQDITARISGGKIGGLIQYRDTNLTTITNTLGRIALTLADSTNNQQQLGLDLNGNAGKGLFSDINSASMRAGRVSAPSSNSAPASLDVTITNTSLLTSSDYELSFTSATNYTLLRKSDGTTTTGTIGGLPTAIATADGFAININSGTFATGDRFVIQPTASAARDLRVALNKPEELAFAQPITTGAALTNTGSGVISAGTMLAPLSPPGALSPPVLVRFTSATAYEILDNTNSASPVSFAPPVTGTITPGQANTVTIHDPVTGAANAVYSVDISGYPATGDSFTVNFNASGSSDNRNALALANLSSAKIVGGSTLAASYGQLVSDVGSRTAELKINRDAADTLVTQAQANRDSISGVNLDEEAANLVKFEQAYNASAQVISIARSIFDTLLGAFR